MTLSTFNYTGASQTYVVPTGITSVYIECFGAQGGGNTAGFGGISRGRLAVTPGESLTVNVPNKPASFTAGFGGGGNGGDNSSDGFAGGGAADVRQGGTALANRVIVAGGGGGKSSQPRDGGSGGGDSGLPGDFSAGTGGIAQAGGGTQSAGGTAGNGNPAGTAGSLGVGGNGGANTNTCGGGGGGGYFGGGGGGGIFIGQSGDGGGGGGSGYVGGVTFSATTPGGQTGDGLVTINDVIPSVNVDVGSFTKTSGPTTGNQDITIPRDLTAATAGTWAIMFWTAGSDQASGTWDAGIKACIGFTTGAANSYAVAISSEDAVASSNTGRRAAAKCLTFIAQDGVTTTAEADFVSFPTATTMRINWTTNANDALFNTIVVNYKILSGLTGAKVVDWTAPTTAIDKAVTGVGFSPDLVLNIASGITVALPASGQSAYPSFGMMNKHGQQCFNATWASDNINPSNTSRWQQTDAAIGYVGPTEGVNMQAHFKSMDPDGFTTNFSAVDATTIHIISLCIKGVSSKIGAFVTAASPQTVDTRQGFTAKGTLFSNARMAPQGVPFADAGWGLGAFDGVNNRASSFRDTDAVTPTQASSVGMTDASVFIGNNSTEVKGTLAFTSTAQSVVTYTAAGTGWQILYLLIGNAGINTFPAKVAV